MRSLLPSRQKHSRKLNSFDQVFQSTNYSDTAFTQPQLLLTRHPTTTSTSKPKFRQRCLKTEASQPTLLHPQQLRKWTYKKLPSSPGEQKLKLLTNIRSICKQYEESNRISERMCKTVYDVLDLLVKQESTYGKDMEQFFFILKKLIFSDNEALKQNIQEFGEGEIQPFNYLIMNVIQQKCAAVIARSKEIDVQIEEMAARIVQIDKRYQEKMRLLMIQSSNGCTSMRIEHQAEVFQLNLKIELLRETVENYERNFRKAGMDIPVVRESGVTKDRQKGRQKGIERKGSKKTEVGEVELEIQ